MAPRSVLMLERAKTFERCDDTAHLSLGCRHLPGRYGHGSGLLRRQRACPACGNGCCRHQAASLPSLRKRLLSAPPHNLPIPLHPRQRQFPALQLNSQMVKWMLAPLRGISPRSAPGLSTPVGSGLTAPCLAGAPTITANPCRQRVSSPRSARELATPAGSGPTGLCPVGAMTVSVKPHCQRVSSSRSARGLATPAGSGPTAPWPAGA